MINVKDKKSLPSSQGFICEQPSVNSESGNAASVSGNTDGAAVAQTTLKRLTPSKMGLLLFNLDQAKNVLRHKVEDNLHENLSFPELVDHVVDCLIEVAQADPQQRKRLGF